MSATPVAYGVQHVQSGQLIPSSQMQPQQQIVPQQQLLAANDPKIHTLILELTDPITRESALLELSKKREQYDDLALVLWHSFGIPLMLPQLQNAYELRYSGIMAALLQEIVSVYPLLSPPALTAHASNRVCNALALLQCVASHSDTRQLFLNGSCSFSPAPSTFFMPNSIAHIPLFLYPFLNTTSKTRPFEYLRLTSLGVIGALVKVRLSG